MSFTVEQMAQLRELLAGGPGPEPIRPEDLPPRPTVVVPEPPPPPPPPDRKRARLYSPARRGFMRSTREEGVGAEHAAMTEEARGSPFFDTAPERTAAGAGLLRRTTAKKEPKK